MLKEAFRFSENFASLVLFRVPLDLLNSTGKYPIDEIDPIELDFKFDEDQRARWTHFAC